MGLAKRNHLPVNGKPKISVISLQAVICSLCGLCDTLKEILSLTVFIFVLNDMITTIDS